jgi:hypothetical protein
MKIIFFASFLSLYPTAGKCADDCNTAIKSIVYRTGSSSVRLDDNTVGIVGDKFSATISCKGALPSARVSTLEENLPNGFFELVSTAGEAATGVPKIAFFVPAQDCYRKSRKSAKAEIAANDQVIVFCGPENFFVVAKRPQL